MTEDSGMDTQNLFSSVDFMSRKIRPDNPERKIRALRRIAKLLAERPAGALQELVNLAVDECHGDSSGVSREERTPEGSIRFRWVSIAGSFSRYLGGTTPREYSPCGTCLDRDVPQHYRLYQPYYDFLGVTADPILDGILIPWHGGGASGTIWLVSHRSTNEFDRSDYELLAMIADIVATALQFQGREQSARTRDLQKGRDERSSELAHAINNPLQGVTNSIFLAEQNPIDCAEHLRTAAQELKRVSDLVAHLLADTLSRPKVAAE